MVVEDAPALRDIAERLLSKAGYDVVCYPDGTALFGALPEPDRPPDLLLSDIVMPGLSGPEVADEVRRRHPGIRVLLMSGYTAGLMDHPTSPGSDEVLEKPFTATTLLTAVRRALDAVG